LVHISFPSFLIYHPLGASYAKKEIENNERSVQLHLWDTAGLEKYESLLPLYLRDANTIMIFFSIGEPETFAKVEYYLDFVRKQCPSGAYILLVGTKSDLRSEMGAIQGARIIGYDEVQAFAANNGIEYIEVSSKEGKNVNEAFQKAAEEMIKRLGQEEEQVLQKSSEDPKSSCTIF